VAVEMTIRELSRNRIALVLLVVIPTVFCGVVAATTPEDPVPFQLASAGKRVFVDVNQRHQSLVFIGVACVGFLTSFLAMNLMQRNTDAHRRLVLCGTPPAALVLAKLGVLGIVLAVVSAYVVLILTLFFEAQHILLVWLGLAVAGWVYGTYGLLVGAALSRELEGILLVVLLANIDAGWLQNPAFYAGAQNTEIIRALPAYFPSQVTMVGAFSDYSIRSPLAGSLFYGLCFLGLALWCFGRRLRVRRSA
jgi:hypothetical protein